MSRDNGRYSYVERERKKTLSGIGPESLVPRSDLPSNHLQIRWKGIVANVPAGIVAGILGAAGIRYLAPPAPAEKMVDEIADLREDLKKTKKELSEIQEQCEDSQQELNEKIKSAARATNSNIALIRDAIRPLGAKVEWQGMPPATHEYLPQPLEGSTAPPIQPRGALITVPEQ